jgi:serine protease DegQ
LLRRIWLVFAQACTLCLAALFVVTTLRPDLLSRARDPAGQVVLVQETSTPVSTPKIATFSDAAKKAMPSVVGIYTSKELRQRSPLTDDPILRRYFPTSRSACPGNGRRASAPA